MTDFKDYREFVGERPGKFFKETLFQGGMLMVGINCLEPGQVQAVHEHPDQDKAYIVMEGTGRFTVGGVVHVAGPGVVVWARAGVPHGVENAHSARLVVLVCMAPPPGEHH